MQLVFPLLLFGSLLAGLPLSRAQERLPLVQGGKAKAVVVIPREAQDPLRQRAEGFIATLRRATGAEVPLLRDDEPLPEGQTTLYLGDCAQTRAAGFSVAELPEETYRIVPRGRAVYVLGTASAWTMKRGSKIDPWYVSEPLRWALNRILEREVGVRWLWPGELGTYVPKTNDVSLPAEEVAHQPALRMRRLGVATMRAPKDAPLRAAAYEWIANHQGGERGDIPLGHGFNHWWEKYHEAHPEYFATPPAGQKQREPGRVKLAMGSAAVLEQIAAEYVEAGRPHYWSVTPNDGAGFDVSETARSWDIPANQPVMEIWNGQTNLTARYVEWWNRIYARLAKENPQVRLATMAYSAYRMPPPQERPLSAKTLIGVVPSLRAYHVWAGWARYSDELILRPNWGWYGANGPYTPLGEYAAYMRYAAENGMVGFSLDSILGFWGTQGINYYLMARLMNEPQLSVEEVLSEYCAAFGKGAPHVRDYLRYWDRVSTEWAHGHKVHKVPEGPYDALIREGKVRDNPLIGPRDAIPSIYTDATLAPAFALLDAAEAAIGDSDAEATARVAFLRGGLEELRLTRDCIVLGKAVEKSRDPAQLKALKKLAAEHDALREKLNTIHAIWATVATRMEDRIKYKLRPRNLSFTTATGDEDF